MTISPKASYVQVLGITLYPKYFLNRLFTYAFVIAILISFTPSIEWIQTLGNFVHTISTEIVQILVILIGGNCTTAWDNSNLCRAYKVELMGHIKWKTKHMHTRLILVRGTR